MIKKYLAILLLVLVLLPTVALAQTTAPGNPCSLAGIKTQTGGAASTLPRCVNQIYVWSLGVAVLLALLMIVVGGYYYMTSSGNAEQAAKGKEYITGALIGIVILFTAYILLNQINPDLVNFNLDSLNGLNKK
ncbi:MAG: hypothetical protein A3I07_03405 [Candidatus Doudnabacteria bacterium RIFCSPLOWO2_02_FULL_42_9]|uniref:Uncharacterized protein n=1 Tax=Candidatus Doudnabacteria bacterium RIFCSPHIGHO2_01_FULL_41_86 TaxID=1817821 RepID=A0A1F5N7V8_9BACT|nr:MAG: hypothetical protein A2717_03855 [Candidatus Doudnabacteria bacterium RIFCSPHIGHO2_01_FULL_41_86]OGE74941.1 MAG: hypothetical protein A3K07_02510 [Candidatus Doudnabacteria bacterium RIFCSPHIGHO2_01_43_10]OGE85771.1 MAG: hypothetical protein A3E28_03185 [Candidatus Doudnabacteria bacterium RIFCSPHIGHO2_12_FULL_42_22]OGE87266.1 MAG: hypothetical protein A3C49_00810 [Candidatus Doudnabacteria bacterium RIFCSPHIGHO2_02_FULL_42_25]OGE92103.1 MAG: hypothetical protein A2895_00685 [Candidatus